MYTKIKCGRMQGVSPVTLVLSETCELKVVTTSETVSSARVKQLKSMSLKYEPASEPLHIKMVTIAGSLAVGAGAVGDVRAQGRLLLLLYYSQV